MDHNRNNTNRWDEWDNKAYRPQQENRNRHDNREQDPDTYRGAYRQDISSDHRHVSTYNGFEGIRNQPEHRRPERENNRYQNRDDYGNQTQDNWHSGRNSHSDNNNYRQEWDERTRQADDRRSGARLNNNWEDNNFNDDYAPDNYRHRRGENAGNMAGTLSFGYDGDRNSNPDAYRRYEPLSGEIRQGPEPIRKQNQDRDFTPGQQNARDRWGHY